MNLLKDIYYKKEYVSLYLKENEEIFDFSYSENTYNFYTISIKRPITSIGKKTINDNYFDLETVYGYGGIYCNTDNEEFLKKANNKYHLYCLKNRIIADFSRIHPFNNTPLCLKKEFNVFLLDRKTVSVNTEITTENRWEIYPSKLRTILRKCKKELVLKKSKNIDSFIFLYEKTMQKNNADDFYYFGRSYFERLINIEGVELYEVLYEDRVISASFFLFGEELGHYHLSANDYEFRKHNANYYILDSVFDIAHKKGIKQFHLGGGRTNLNDDSLLKFKNKFSPLKKDFYIAGIIHNNDIYKKYCEIWENENQKEIKYFLKYRL